MDAAQILELTQARLRLHKGRYAEIARANKDFSHSWLVKFAAGAITNPTIDSLQRLIEALDDFEGVGKPLRVDTPEAVAAVLGVQPAPAAAEQGPAESEDPDPDAGRIGPAELAA